MSHKWFSFEEAFIYAFNTLKFFQAVQQLTYQAEKKRAQKKNPNIDQACGIALCSTTWMGFSS